MTDLPKWKEQVGLPPRKISRYRPKGLPPPAHVEFEARFEGEDQTDMVLEPGSLGYEQWVREQDLEARQRKKHDDVDFFIWMGLVLSPICIVIGSWGVETSVVAKDTCLLVVIMSLAILFFCIIALFRWNHQSIRRTFKQPLTYWVTANYLLLSLPWMLLPWVFEGESFEIAVIVFLVISSPVFLLNATTQMWVRYHRFQSSTIPQYILAKKAGLLTILSMLYMSPLIIALVDVSSQDSEDLCCFSLMASGIVYVLGTIHLVQVYNRLSDNMRLDRHFFFRGEKALMLIIPGLQMFTSVFLFFFCICLASYSLSGRKCPT